MKHIYRMLGVIETDSCKIVQKELQHLRKVLRLKLGDIVEVFDGKGQSGTGRIVSIDSQSAKVDLEHIKKEEQNPKTFSIALGALKPGLIDELLPSLVEFGVDRIEIFLQTSNAKNRISEKAIERWGRIILSAAKQCKRSWLPEIGVWPSLEEFLQKSADLVEQDSAAKLVLQPGDHLNIISSNLDNFSSVIAVIGGERGLDSGELAHLKASGYQKVSMGSNILRAYTATIGAAAILSTLRFR